MATALTVGLAVAVKPVAIVAVPALVLQDWLRGRASRRWMDVTWDIVLSAAPALLASFVFGGPITVARSVLQQGAAPLGNGGRMLGLLIVVAVTVWASRFIQQTATTLQAAWLTAWIPLSVALILIGSRQWFPWYISWALMPALVGWDERHRILTTGTASLGVLLMLAYTYRP